MAQGLAVIQGKSLLWFEFVPGCVALDLLAILLQENHCLSYTLFLWAHPIVTSNKIKQCAFIFSQIFDLF